MSGATTDADAVSALLKSRLYPSFSITGTTVLLITAVCAVDDPIIVARNMLATTLT